jgi:hypothetical protein
MRFYNNFSKSTYYGECFLFGKIKEPTYIGRLKLGIH